jgi:transcriptional regulator with XRE-family HTH domain
MVARPDPAALRWLIGVELARFRNTAGVSLAAVSGLVGMSKAKINHMETGRQTQAPDDIATLLTAYGAGQRDIDRLTSLAEDPGVVTWWAPWAQVLPDWFKTFVGLEGLASREFVFEPIAIPGLLQTADYATAITADSPRVRPDDRERVVDFRLARSERLVDPDRPLHVHALFTEAALRLRIGTPQVRQAQLEHLVVMAERPNVTVQVIRPEDGMHTGYTGQFVVLDFEQAQSVVYVELIEDAVYLRDPDQVRPYSLTAGNLQRAALDPAESTALIRSMIKERQGK